MLRSAICGLRSGRLLLSLFLAGLAGLLAVTPALAIPPLPSSFYGKVQVNGKNVPDGTVVRALIGGNVYAEGRTQAYQGSSVYSLDVPGDEAGTQALEGGREGDTVQFEVGGVLAGQTGTWHSGSNTNLDLSAQTSSALAAPPPTIAPPPTQTAISPGARPTASMDLARVTPVTTSSGGGSADPPDSVFVFAMVIVALVTVGGAVWALVRRKS